MAISARPLYPYSAVLVASYGGPEKPEDVLPFMRNATAGRGVLVELGAAYGDHPAHDGLWQAAQATAGDLMARVAIVPLVLEARGLDVTPRMIEKLRESGDDASADIIAIIYRDEKRHVAFGMKWFRFLCERERLQPESTFHDLVRKNFRGPIKPPFNDAARSEAGLTPGFYKPLSALGAPK